MPGGHEDKIAALPDGSLGGPIYLYQKPCLGLLDIWTKLQNALLKMHVIYGNNAMQMTRFLSISSWSCTHVFLVCCFACAVGVPYECQGRQYFYLGTQL